MKSFLKFIQHYIDPRSTFLGVLMFFSFLTYGLYFSFKIFLGIHLSDPIFWPSALGVTGFTLIKFVESRTRGYNTFCHLEVELNQAMDTLSVLISTLQNMIQNYMPILLPHYPLYLTIDHVKEVGRLDIKNNLADLLCDFRRINQDWNNLVEYGKEHADAIKDPKHSQHQNERVFGTQLLTIVLNRSKSTLKLVEDTLILVRIYLRTDKPFFRFRQPFIWPCDLMIEVQEERKKLETEKNR